MALDSLDPESLGLVVVCLIFLSGLALFFVALWIGEWFDSREAGDMDVPKYGGLFETVASDDDN